MSASPETPGTGPLAPCGRCGRAVSRTPSGHLRAHECPHGSQCVVPYARRRLGEKAAHCGVCSGGALDTRLEPGQMPLPFAGGIRPKLRRKPRRARFPLANGGTGFTCPSCGCDQDKRCAVPLPDGGMGQCIPAGSFGRKVCSACRQPSLPLRFT